MYISRPIFSLYCFSGSISMGRLRKVSRKDVPLVSSVESVDSLRDPYVPNDFADDGSNAMSLGVIICLLIFFPFPFSFSFIFLYFFINFCYCFLIFFFLLQGCSGDDEEFNKALYNFYLNNVSHFFMFLVMMKSLMFLFHIFSYVGLMILCFLFLDQKVKYLKRKLSSAGRRNVVSLSSSSVNHWVICMVATL